MKHVNYISNLDLKQITGGWTGDNVALHRVLSKSFSLNVIGPINPGSDYRGKLVSKARRISGLPGGFHFFSTRRLQEIAKLIEKKADLAADGDFFHGPTPWILFDSPRPYFVYTDTCFSTYMDVYHDRKKFLEDDLKRVLDAEALWLSRAEAVFFGTRWALEQVVSDYGIPGANLHVAGAGGNIAIPEQDNYTGDINFLFIAYDFERKGGRICAEAFKHVRTRFPEARLTLVGPRPPTEILELPGVLHVGLLSKSVPEELARLEQLYSTAFALIHPTSSDIQPLVISEAGYCGCPAIAANSFGIPELVKDGVTGFLINTPLTAEGFADRMLQLCSDKDSYLAMRKAARAYATTSLTWDSVGDRIANIMKRIGKLR